MLIRDTKAGYGLLTRLMHWIMAVAILGMFVLGLWMVTLNYYSPYYQSAPDLHRSVGMLLLFLLVFRLGWRLMNARPDDSDLSRLERVAAPIVHWGLYVLLAALMVSGYLISSSDGRPVKVFDWFSVPALIQDRRLEEPAGEVHEILAWVTIAVAALHSAAALKHHFIDRSRVLTRMWSGPPSDS